MKPQLALLCLASQAIIVVGVPAGLEGTLN